LSLLIKKLKVDDPVGAVGFCTVFVFIGTLLVGILPAVVDYFGGGSNSGVQANWGFTVELGQWDTSLWYCFEENLGLRSQRRNR
jgi:ammonia channel protein AmtB